MLCIGKWCEWEIKSKLVAECTINIQLSELLDSGYGICKIQFCGLVMTERDLYDMLMHWQRQMLTSKPHCCLEWHSPGEKQEVTPSVVMSERKLDQMFNLDIFDPQNN